MLLMSSGSYGNSHLDILDIRNEPLQTVKTVPLESVYFGEGITYLPDTKEIIMLTYKKRKAFRFNLDLVLLEEMIIPTSIREGWGMTHVGNEVLVSDGTDKLFYIQPETFVITRTVQVRDNGNAIQRINELEHVDGKIYANVFMSNDLLVLSLDAVVLDRYDMSELLKLEQDYNKKNSVYWNSYDVANNVLNGIAYHKSSDTFFVTGKNWHFIY